MNSEQTPESDGVAHARDLPSGGRPPALIALSVLLLLEGLLVALVAVWLLIELVVATPASYASALALVVLAVAAAVWLICSCVATLRGRSWVRAAAITWQVVQLAAAVGFFQGADARPGLAWALLVPSLIGIGLALAPQVAKATARER